MIKTITYTLPSYWASALINNDFSGLSQSDNDDCLLWLVTNNTGNCLACDNQNTAGRYEGLICDVMDYTFVSLGG